MRNVIVQYKVKPARIEEHEALIRAVFAELASARPHGLRYAALKQPDGQSFVHVAFIEGTENPLQQIAAFKAFTADIADRCEVQPDTVTLTAIGSYGV
jgi:hypothetical protein